MPNLFQYHIFISHAWRYGIDYDKLVSMLNSARYFFYMNYSAPKDKPLQNLDATDVTTKNQIKAAINRKIAPCSCVLVLAGMYYNYREWMQYEIETAIKMGKPIIVIRPWGADRLPIDLLVAATEVVGWNTDSIVAAIKKHSK